MQSEPINEKAAVDLSAKSVEQRAAELSKEAAAAAAETAALAKVQRWHRAMRRTFKGGLMSPQQRMHYLMRATEGDDA